MSEEERKEAAKKWLENRYNLSLLGIMVLALVVRIYFFVMAKDQAHWWDTLAYASIAKNMVLGLWDSNHFIISESLIRPPLLPLIWTFLMKLHVSEVLTLILIEIIPSLISIYLIYGIGKELYNERVGLFSALLFSVSWLHLFYSVRIMTDIPSLFLSLLSIYFFVKSYENFELKGFSLSILFLSLAVLMRYSYGLIGFAYLIFLGIVYREKVLGKKNFWIGGIIGVIPLIIFFLSNLIGSGKIFPAVGSYAESAADKPEFAYYVFGFMPHILRSVLLGLFIIGGVLVLGELIIGYNLLSKVKKLRSHSFLIILLIVSLGFFVFIIKAAEDRYLLMIFPSVLVFGSIALIKVYNFLRGYSKQFAIILIAILLLFSSYQQLTFANSMIGQKTASFLPMKQAFVWIEGNTPQDSVILGDWADPYAIYYSERRLGAFPTPLVNLDNFSLEGIDYFTLTSVHQPTPVVVDFANRMAQEGKIAPIQVFFFDQAQQQPAVIIYKVNWQ